MLFMTSYVEPPSTDSHQTLPKAQGINKQLLKITGADKKS